MRKRNKLQRYANGTPWAFAKDPKDGMTQNQFSGVANLAGGAGTLVSAIGAANEDVNAVDYGGAILSNAGSMAAAGAALGPWGAVGGAALGAGIGIAQSISQDRAQQAQRRQTAINTNLSNISMDSEAIQSNYNNRNDKNYRVVGFKKGVAKFNSAPGFSPNAMVSNGEAIKDPDTGQLGVIPGVYDPSRPDKIPAKLKDGTSVYSAAKPIPGGKSTPAALVAKMKRVQDGDALILNKKRPGSRIDIKTAELNKQNIDKQTELLNMNTVIENALAMSANKSRASKKLPGYWLGDPAVPGSQTYSTDEHNGMLPYVKYPGNIKGKKPGIELSPQHKRLGLVYNPEDDYYYIPVDEKVAAENPNIVQWAAMGADEKGNPQLGKNNFVGDRLKTYDLSGGNATPSATKAGVGTKSNVAAPPIESQSAYPPGMDISTNAQNPGGVENNLFPREMGAIIPDELVGDMIMDGKTQLTMGTTTTDVNGKLKRSIIAPGQQPNFWESTDWYKKKMAGSNPVANSPIEHPRSSVEDLKLTSGSTVPTGFDDAANRLKTSRFDVAPEPDYVSKQPDDAYVDNMDFLKKKSLTKYPEFQDIKWPNTSIAPEPDYVSKQPDDEDKNRFMKDNPFDSSGDKLSEIGTDLASLAPAMYNMFAKPETWRPTYDRAINPNMRVNISKNIEDARRQRQIARYNQRSMNSGSGQGNAFGASIYGQGVENLNQIMSSADNQNNQYRAASADISNKVNQANRGEDRRIQDINARNRAAARNMRSTGLSQIGQYAQNKQLGKNQMKSDMLNSKVWEAMASGNMSPELINEFMGMMTNFQAGESKAKAKTKTAKTTKTTKTN